MNEAALQGFVTYSGLAFFAGLLFVVVWSFTDRRLSLDGLLRVKGGYWNGQPSPARVTALLSTVAFVVMYVPQILEAPEDIRRLDVPEGWLVAIGGTHLTYLLGKAYSLLGRPRR